MMTSTQLMDLALRSVVHGNFKLASGAESDWFFDASKIALRVDALETAAYYMARHLWEMRVEFDAVAAVPTGGIPFAVALAARQYRKTQQPVPLCWPGKRGLDAGDGLRGGMRVVLVEDVLTTGASAMRTAETLREQGLEVVHLVALLDRPLTAERYSLPVLSWSVLCANSSGMLRWRQR